MINKIIKFFSHRHRLSSVVTTVIVIVMVIVITTIVVNAWTNPSDNPPGGGGALYYSNGNVGIGTSTPNQELDLVGDLKLENTISNDTGVIYKKADRFIHNFKHPTGSSTVPDGYNTFVGVNAGNFTMGSEATETYHGSYNSAMGVNALNSNTTGYANTANGYAALYNNTTGNANTANGYAALYNNTTGNANTANGYQALYSNTTGYRNTVNGFRALSSNTTGYQNTANGYLALYFNTIGYANTANGYAALYNNTTGYHNAAMGRDALSSNSTGYYNSAIGTDALSSNTTGSNNIGIGSNAQVRTETATNEVRMGNTNITYAGIQVGWTVTSDARVKSDIKEINNGLSIINHLRPVSFIRNNTLKQGRNNREFGFISQEVEQIQTQDFGKNVVETDMANGKAQGFEDGVKTLRYDDIIAPLVKSVQELEQKIISQSERVDQLEAEISQLKANCLR